MPHHGRSSTSAVFGEDCKESATSNGCSIVVNGGRAWYTSSHGIVDRVPHLRLASTGRGRWLGGITSVSDTGGKWAIVRLGIDGSMEYAVAPRRGRSDLSPPFQLQTR